jgi:hypothetical protein
MKLKLNVCVCRTNTYCNPAYCYTVLILNSLCYCIIVRVPYSVATTVGPSQGLKIRIPSINVYADLNPVWS